MRYAIALAGKGKAQLSQEEEISIRQQVAAGTWASRSDLVALEEDIQETMAEWKHYGVRVARHEIVILEIGE